ncbi:MAG: hypothetical protein V4465_00460 [Patescibacteria group bacterium]
MPNTELELRFNDLEVMWKKDTEETSSIREIITHPAYEEIMRMGEEAVPFILRSFQKEIDHWAPALMTIVQVNPVPRESAGKMEKIRDAWIKWGRENRYI